MNTIKDILHRDPATHPLVNQGQARMADTSTDKVIDELRGELAMFICEGQFADGLQRILSSYLTNLNQSSQKATWVSGFYGSGKSHLVKMLVHLWQDTRFPDGSTARSLVPAMPDDIRHLLRELDTAGKRRGGVLAAGGALPSGTTDNVRLTILGILLRAVGLPEQYAQAQFCLWLHQQGFFDRVKTSIESAGKVWASELNNLYVSGPIAKAILACDPSFSASEIEARKTLRAQFPPRTTDISTDEFLTTFRQALDRAGRDGRLPCTVLVLDEVQQYIGDSSDRSTLVTEVAEAVSKQLNSHVIVVGAGQSALTEVRLLHKLMDRFTLRVSLSDSDVETVTRKVLLQKKPTALTTIHRLLESHAGEVSRQLQGTRISEGPEDRDIIVDDYPLLPVRRRFWEHCFRQVDAAGTSSQLRSQLRIIHDAVAKLSPRALGAIVPADELYDSLAPEMVNTGVLLREINERIINLARDGSSEGHLARRICGLVFLIGKLPREAAADIGVRATPRHIGDLLVEDLKADNGKLRSAVETVLVKLASQGALMQIGDEYRLQTKEGSEWDREFRNRQTRLANDDAEIQLRRDALLYAQIDERIKALKIIQGAAKEARHLVPHRDQTPPQVTAEGIPVWVRDQWSSTEKESLEAARAAGSDSPIIFVFIQRQSAEDLRQCIVDTEAADRTLNTRGVPTTPEGLDARRSMESRRDLATGQRNEIVKQIVANARVFQGGGAELLQLSLEDKIKEAATASLARLFPRFKEGDATGWESAIKRARDGADRPFEPVGHSGSTEQHPVCQQVLSTIGAGKAGTEIRKPLRSRPYGWPQDAIDAALIALHRSQHVTATLNGAPVQLGQLDQNRIAKTEFRVEKATISVSDRLALRGLFQLLGVSCKPGEEAAKAHTFLQTLTGLASTAGGPAPLPDPPSTVDIDDLQRLTGNEQLAAIKQKSSDLEKRIGDWKKARDLAAQRRPIWETVERLARHAAVLPQASEHLAQVEAIRNQRLLFAPTDPVAPLRTILADALRRATQDAHTSLRTAHASGLSALASSDVWSRLSDTDQSDILNAVGLVAPDPIDVSTDAALLATLDQRPLANWKAEADAVPGRVQQALERAARHLEPKVQIVNLERTTLRSKDDIRRWLERQEKTLLNAIQNGPVHIN